MPLQHPEASMTAENATTSASRLPALLDALAKSAAPGALMLGLAAILGALASQYLWGLEPCALCLEQRLPYYWGLPILAGALVLGNRLPRVAWSGAVAIVAGLFVWGAYLGVYHAGIEWGFWQGPAACAGTGTSISFSDLGNINAARVVPCDVVQFRFLGLSLAGYNVLISLGVIGLLAIAFIGRWRRGG